MIQNKLMAHQFKPKIHKSQILIKKHYFYELKKNPI